MAAALVAVVLTAVEGCSAVITGTVLVVVVVVAATAMAVLMRATEIVVVVAADTGTIMSEMVVAVAMALGVAVVGIAVTMTEGAISPLGTIPELCQRISSSSSLASISLGHFNGRHHHHLLPISWCHSLLCHMFHLFHTLVSQIILPFVGIKFLSLCCNVVSVVMCSGCTSISFLCHTS